MTYKGSTDELMRVVECQCSRNVDGACLISRLHAELQKARSKGMCFVSHVIDNSTACKQVVGMMSKPTVKGAFESVNDIGIAVGDNRIIVAVNSYVANETLEQFCQKPAKKEAIPA